MTTKINSVRELIDRELIRDCLCRYCRAIDRRDPELLRSCYWPDAIDDHSSYVGPVEGFIKFAMDVLAIMPVTQHSLGHSLIEVRTEEAVAETHFLAYHRVKIKGNDSDILLSGRYLDRLQRRNDEWRIFHRVLINDWLRELGESVDWSKGLLGNPFKSENGIGSARGDYSEKLFPRLSPSG